MPRTGALIQRRSAATLPPGAQTAVAPTLATMGLLSNGID